MSSRLGFVADVMATESPSQLRPVVIQRTWAVTASVFLCSVVHRARHRLSSLASTDPRQRVAHQLIHHSPAAKARLHQHHPRRLGPHLADLRRLLAARHRRAARPAPRPPPRVRRTRPACPRSRRTSGRSRGSPRRPPPPAAPGPRSRARSSPPTTPGPARSAPRRRRPGSRRACSAARRRRPRAGSRPPARASGCPTRSSASSSNSLRASMIAVPCSPIGPDRMIRSPGRSAAGDSVARGSRRPIPVVHTYIPSAWPRSTTLVSPATISTPADAGRVGDRLDLGPQLVRRQALLEHERERQRERPRPGDREVVHGAVHRELADRAAGEPQRLDDVGVGREREPDAVDDELAGIGHRLERLAAERRHEQPLDQRLGRLPAGAVGHRDLRVAELRRAGRGRSRSGRARAARGRRRR